MAKKKHTDERERIMELLLSQDESNIKLAFQLQRSAGVDLSDFWADLAELYKISNSKDASNKFLLLNYANELTDINITTKHPLYTEGINAENSYLKNLQKIILNGANEHALPFWVYSFSQIKFLIFSGFNLYSLHPDMQGLRNLRSLNLCKQPLAAIPDWLGNFEQLRELNLSSLGLRQLPDFIRKLTKLRYLFVADNQLEELPEWLGELKDLRILDIRVNNIKKLPTSLSNLHKLKDLRLSENPDLDWKQALFIARDLPGLEMLYWLDRETLAFEPPLDSHDMIILSRSLQSRDWEKAVEVVSYMLSDFKELEMNDLGMDVIPNSIKKIESLEQLHLQYNPITALPDFLLEMPNLKFLDLRGTAISEIPAAFEQKEGLEIKR